MKARRNYIGCLNVVNNKPNYFLSLYDTLIYVQVFSYLIVDNGLEAQIRKQKLKTNFHLVLNETKRGEKNNILRNDNLYFISLISKINVVPNDIKFKDKQTANKNKTKLFKFK